MKIILTGSSGFIGTEILTQALSRPEITSIVALTRKPLPESISSNPKITVVLNVDFDSYTPDVLKQLEGAECCIWAIGNKSLDIETTRRVRVGYTLAGAKAFANLPRPREKPFRFVLLSGFIMVRDPNASTWFFGEARKLAGEAELNLVSLAANSPELHFEPYIARPAFVLPKKGGGLTSMAMSLLPSVKVDALAGALLDVAVRGGEVQTLENADLVRRGRRLGL